MERVITSSNHFLGLRVYFVIFTLFCNAIIQTHYVHVAYMHKIKRIFNKLGNGKEKL